MVIVALLLFLPMAFSFTQFNDDTNTITTILGSSANSGNEGLEFKFRQDGAVKISKTNDDKKTFLGFGITGNVGGMDMVVLSSDFNWTWDWRDLNGTGLYMRGNNNSGLIAWEQDYNFFKHPTKITHRITNNLANATDVKFWFLHLIDPNDFVEFDSQKFFANGEIVRDINVMNRGLQTKINDVYNFNFEDLVEDGYSIERVFIGKGTPIGKPNMLVLGIGVTKNAGVFPLGATAVLDPNAITSDQELPNTTGTFDANWDNHAALTTDDGNFAHPNGVGSKVDTSDYNLGVPAGSVIIGLLISTEMSVGCEGDGQASVEVELSWDGANNYTDLNREFVAICGGGGTFSVGGGEDMWGRFWQGFEVGDGNFYVRLELTQQTANVGVVNMDWVSTIVQYATAPDMNVTAYENNLFGPDDLNALTLAVTETTFPYDFNTIILYTPFDINGRNQPDLSRFKFNQLGQPTNVGSQLPVFNPDGNIGGSYDFVPAQGNRFEIGSNSRNDLNRMTISAWVKKDSNSTSGRTIVQKGAGNTSMNYWLRTRTQGSGGKGDPVRSFLRFSVTDTDNVRTDCISATQFNNNEWHNVTAVYDGFTQKIYRDGEEEISCVATGVPLKFSTDDLFIGARNDTFVAATGFWDGDIDEVLILDVNISAAEVKNIFLHGINKVYPSGTHTFSTFDIGTNDTIDINIQATRPLDSNISVTIGDWNGTDFVFDKDENFFDSDNNVGNLAVETPNMFALRFNFTAGGLDGNFFVSPVMDANFNLFSSALANPCGCPASGDLNVACFEGCVISSSCDLGGNNIILHNDDGAGTITVDADVNNWNRTTIEDTCALQINTGKRFGGGT